MTRHCTGKTLHDIACHQQLVMHKAATIEIRSVLNNSQPSEAAGNKHSNIMMTNLAAGYLRVRLARLNKSHCTNFMSHVTVEC